MEIEEENLLIALSKKNDFRVHEYTCNFDDSAVNWDNAKVNLHI